MAKKVEQSEASSEDKARIIKKYPNRRLYDTELSHYIKLDDLYQMIKDQVRFRVIEEKTKNDITQSILLQVLIEQENNHRDVLTVDSLRTLLNFYREPTHAMVGRYLEHCLSIYRDYQISLKSPVNSMLPTDKQASHLHEAAEQAHESWKNSKE